jgi:hypothetical protein
MTRGIELEAKKEYFSTEPKLQSKPVGRLFTNFAFILMLIHKHHFPLTFFFLNA